jgi:O-antigen ligase
VLWGSIIAATGLHNFVTGQMYRNSDRIWGYSSSLAANPDDLGLVLNVILSLTIGIFLAARRRSVKALLVVVMAMAAAGVIVSFSRGAFLALAVTLALILAKLVRAQGPLVLAPAAALLVLGMALAPAGYGDRLYSLFDWNLDRVGSIDRRWQEVQVAFTFLLENPLIGAGVGMDALVFVEEGLGHGWETHNIFLQVGADLGLPGLLVYVLLIVQVLRGLRRTQRSLAPIAQAREIVAIATGLELAVWSFLVGGFFLTVPYDFTFFYLAGMAVAIRVIGERLAAPALPAR